MTAAPIHLAGERLMLDPAGACSGLPPACSPSPTCTWRRAPAFARKGMLLPPWDTHATLDRLALLLRRYQPRIVVALGDSFHDADGAGRLPHGELARLQAMTEAHRFIWVLGNHDPAPPAGLGGEWVPEFETATLVFRHHAIAARHGGGDQRALPSQGGRAGTRRFAVSPVFCRRLPPADAARLRRLYRRPGRRDPAISRLFPRGARVFLLGKDRLFSFTFGEVRQVGA